MSFIKFCEDRGYDPGMDMSRELRIHLAEAYARHKNEELQKQVEELNRRFINAKRALAGKQALKE